MAFRNLWRRKSRTILTILSVVIGTTSIIMMLSLGIGMQEQQRQMVDSFGGIETIEIMNQEGSSKKINEATVNKFKKIPGVKVVIPRKDFYAEIKVKGKDKYSLPTYQGIRVMPDEVFEKLTIDDFEEGNKLSKSDKNSIIVGSQSQVEEEKKEPGQNWYINQPVEGFDLLSADYILQLGYSEESGPNFGENTENNTSKPTIAKIPIKVKGKLNNKSFLGGYFVYTNESTYKTIEKEDSKLEMSMLNQFAEEKGMPKNKNKYFYDGISVVCNDYESVKQVETQIKDLGYQTQSNTQMIEEINKSMSGIMMILGGIGSIAFIVSAIGIINTMLMSIYERQKEIGVMKVIGASIGDIRSMFLLESGFIGFFGGIVGLLISIALSKVLNTVFMNAMDPSGMGEGALFSIPIWLALVGVLFSAMVGVLAGYLPAKRATKLSAIDTLRSN